MWQVNNSNQLIMNEGDYNINLPFIITNVTVASGDHLIITIKRDITSDTLITKNYTGITDNTFNFTLTSSETALLPAGEYKYSLRWTGGTGASAFATTIIAEAKLTVVAHI